MVPAEGWAREILVTTRRVYLEADTLRLDIGLDSLFSRRSMDAIESGMTTSITMEFQIGSRRKARLLNPVLDIRLNHDIWEGRYTVIRHRAVPDTLITTDFEEASWFCSHMEGIALGPAPAETGELSLRTRVGVDPISPEQRRRTRSWLDFLDEGGVLEFFISLDRPSERTNWLELDRFTLEDLR
jgi:hypothetical protein